MAIKYTSTKIKKEKPVKIKKEKPLKIKKSANSAAKSRVRIKAEKKPTVAINGLKDKEKSAKTKKIVIILLCVTLALALIAVGISLYVKYIKQLEADGRNISSVYISSYPNKVKYYIGDTIPDYTGLKLGITLKNGTQQEVEYSKETAADFTFKDFDCSAYSDGQKVTVIYKGHECQFNIIVKERPQETPILAQISLETLPKTEYKVGEWLNTTGGVILLEYTNHAPQRVNLMNNNVDGWEEAYEAGPGTYTLTVWYVENGILKETTYDITITE